MALLVRTSDESFRSSYREPLHPLRPRLLEGALLELRPAAEELLVGGGGHLVLVLERRKLHGADAVRRLREPVVDRRR